jgi:hypothetical protein
MTGNRGLARFALCNLLALGVFSSCISWRPDGTGEKERVSDAIGATQLEPIPVIPRPAVLLQEKGAFFLTAKTAIHADRAFGAKRSFSLNHFVHQRISLCPLRNAIREELRIVQLS